MKKVVGLICLMFLLVSCGENNDTINIQDFSMNFNINEKNDIIDNNNLICTFEYEKVNNSLLDVFISKQGDEFAYTIRDYSTTPKFKETIYRKGKEFNDNNFNNIALLGYAKQGEGLYYYGIREGSDGMLSDKYTLLNDGKKIFTSVGMPFIVKNANKGKYQYFLTEDNGKEVIIANGIVSKHYDDIQNIIFSNDGTKILFTAKNNGKLLLVDNGKEKYVGIYDDIGSITYSNNGKKNGFTAEKDGKTFLVNNGEEKYIKYDTNYITKIEYLFNNNDIILESVLNGKLQIHINDKKIDINEYKGNFVHTFDGKNYAFNIEKGIIKNGTKILEGYDNVYNPYFSEDGKDFYFHGELDGKDFFVKNGINGKGYDGIYQKTFSKNGKHYLFYTKIEGKYILVVDGNESKQFDRIDNIQFSENGKKVVASATSNGKESIIKVTCD